MFNHLVIYFYRDKDGISLCSRHFDGASGPLAYPEETSEKDEECGSSSSGSGQHQRGSSSCPTSPHLRKASPAPSEDTRSTRGKKCTRFMDQVSEIESKSDCLSIGSIISTSSSSPCYEGVSPTMPTYSTLSLTTAPITTQAALASCESLMSEGKAESIGASDICQAVSIGSAVRMKAESTSKLMDGADSRRCEMGGTRRKSDTRSRDDINSAERSLVSRKKKGSVGEKEHRSQPGNLSDISEIRGMPSLHAAGCPDLLAVIDTKCENVFIEKKSRLLSASSSCSSSFDDPMEFRSSRRYHTVDRVVFESKEDMNAMLEYGGSFSDVAHSLSDVNISGLDGPLKSVMPSSAIHLDKQSLTVSKKENVNIRTWLSSEDGQFYAESEKVLTALCKRDSCVSRTSIGSDCGLAASPLPDVEMPNCSPDAAAPSQRGDEPMSLVLSPVVSRTADATRPAYKTLVHLHGSIQGTVQIYPHPMGLVLRGSSDHSSSDPGKNNLATKSPNTSEVKPLKCEVSILPSPEKQDHSKSCSRKVRQDGTKMISAVLTSPKNLHSQLPEKAECLHTDL